ncbi:hypothetical protein GDO81_004473 [Engystomops pustulosus]|uniref:Uncharacterized protein n=1 Tax=Engystomops pustulosus TaxID=76066 RepID=A0AAV6ZXL6_ENGPU|nr:hypothetical protein GDO81_004473 [Engystomops pustulosus]
MYRIEEMSSQCSVTRKPDWLSVTKKSYRILQRSLKESLNLQSCSCSPSPLSSWTNPPNVIKQLLSTNDTVDFFIDLLYFSVV